jgi:hypothetical protein
MITTPAFEELRGEVAGLAGKLSRCGPIEPLQQRRLNDARERLSAECLVVICGEFSRGKSSLLNALVERAGLFPVGSDVSTAVVTELRWGEQEAAEVFFGDGSKLTALSAVGDYVNETRNPDNAKDVREVKLAAPLALLRSGLVLVDTPGIGSLNVEHATATYAYLGEADAVLFVAAADERMSTSELSYVAKAISKCPVVITVLTKIEKLFGPGPEDEVSVARKRIAGVTERSADDVLAVGVSSRRKRDAQQTGDKDLLRKSGFPDLTKLLAANLVATWGKACLTDALNTLAEVHADMTEPVENELSALSSDDALEKACAALGEARGRAIELTAESASWRTNLADSFEAEARHIAQQLADDCDAVKFEFGTAAHSSRAVSDPDALVREAYAHLVDAIEAAGTRLRDATEGVAARASDETRLQLTARAARPHVDVDLRTPSVLSSRHRSTGLVQSAFKSAATGMGVGTAMGAAIGTLIFPGVGTLAGLAGGLAGQVVGLFAGLRDHFVKVGLTRQAQQTEWLSSLVLPRIEHIIGDIQANVAEASEVTEKYLLAELNERIMADRQVIANSLETLEEQQTATEEERRRKHRELLARSAELNGIDGQLKALRKRVQALG